MVQSSANELHLTLVAAEAILSYRDRFSSSEEQVLIHLLPRTLDRTAGEAACRGPKWQGYSNVALLWASHTWPCGSPSIQSTAGTSGHLRGRGLAVGELSSSEAHCPPVTPGEHSQSHC